MERATASAMSAFARAGGIALVLLVAAVSAAGAAPAFVEWIGAENPLDGVDVGGFATPAFADLDDDGDLDFLAGERFGALFLFANTGDATSAVFSPRTGAESPFDGVGVDEYSWPTFADLDADGDVDLVSGEHFDPLHYFENIGSANAPAFAERTGAANPFAALTAGNNAAPGFADLDDDGDLDLVTGGASGGLRWFENSGSSEAASFVGRTGAANPLDGLGVAGFSSAAFADADGDGDSDVVSGKPDGGFAWFENVGTAGAPAFVELVAEENPLAGLSAGTFAAATFADLDGDGATDLVSGSGSGRFRVFGAPEPSATGAGAAALGVLSLRRLARKSFRAR